MDSLKRQRLVISICGAVQGVGFRPFVYLLAKEQNLKGWVCNTSEGVTIEVEGRQIDINEFLTRTQSEGPPNSYIANLQYTQLDLKGYSEFTINESEELESTHAVILPEIATCEKCVEEIFDETNRRHLYPFTNCTHCGPRFSIIEKLPYDRANTSMKIFSMCPECNKEYEDPLDRRFHAQPNACPVCGPTVELWDKLGRVIDEKHESIVATVAALRGGKIVAVKGIGGFHLMVDAGNDAAVRELRARKGRDEKPFALMFKDLKAVKEHCIVCRGEEEMLVSGASPIVLLSRKKSEVSLAASVAPGNPCYGSILPYTPLHHILMRELQTPLVATSGNISNEPICFDETEAVERLGGIADFFLVHNRPILRPLDDSVIRFVMGRPLMIRRARGYAPLPVPVKLKSKTVIATGAHLKSTTAVKLNENIFISQHVGNLETQKSFESFKQTIHDFKNLFNIESHDLACDLHPDYLSTQYAEATGNALHRMQHHHAHIVSCMAENQLEEEVLGIAWDGTGFGEDSTIWGGEFLLAQTNSFKRIGRIRNFRLPGAEKAVNEPCRIAISLLYEMDKDFMKKYEDLPFLNEFNKSDLKVLINMIEQGINAPYTSSMGRLFDGIASLIGLNQKVSFEGQAAMGMEYVIGDFMTDEAYECGVIEKDSSGNFIIDWVQMLAQIIEDIYSNVDKAEMSAKFHNTVIEMGISLCKKVGEKNIVLSGGCFQNRYLTERMVTRLREEKFKVYWHQWIPPNDGGISLGQAMYAASRSQDES